MSRAKEKKKPEPNPLVESFTNPAARVYLLIGGLGLAVLALTMFLVGSPLAAAVLLSTGASGLLLRWTAMPVFTIIALAYLSFAPIGIPFDVGRFTQIPGSSFVYTDLIIVAAALVYLTGQYRLLTLVHQGMPFDAGLGDRQGRLRGLVRPSLVVSDPELIRFFVRVGLAVLAGQLLWLAVTNLAVDFRRVPPIIIAEEEFTLRKSGRGFDPLESRYLLTASAFLILAVGLRAVFWYWRLQTMNRDQARLILHDTAWSENRRQLSRQEKWRAYAKALALGEKPPTERLGWGFYLIVVLIVVFVAMLSMCIWS